MAEMISVMEFLTRIAAGVSVIGAFVAIALSMTFFLITDRLSHWTKSTTGSDDHTVSQLAVLKDNIMWMLSLRPGKGTR